MTVAALAGEFLPLLALLAAVAGATAVSRAEVVAVRTVDDWTPGHGYGRVGLVLALLAGGLVHAGTVAVADGARYNVGLVVLGVTLLVAVNALVGEGEVDPEAGIVRYHGDELPLDAVRSVRAVSLGDRVVAFVRYRGGVPTASRVPTFSAAAFEAAEPMLRGDGDAAPAEGSTADGRDGLPRAVRATAAAMGVGALALAGGVYLIAPADARPLVVILVVTSLPVTVVLGWYAYGG